MFNEIDKKIIKNRKYKTYNIQNIIYYSEEFAYFKVIMNDDLIFTFDSIEYFIEFYNFLKENK